MEVKGTIHALGFPTSKTPGTLDLVGISGKHCKNYSCVVVTKSLEGSVPGRAGSGCHCFPEGEGHPREVETLRANRLRWLRHERGARSVFWRFQLVKMRSSHGNKMCRPQVVVDLSY